MGDHRSSAAKPAPSKSARLTVLEDLSRGIRRAHAAIKSTDHAEQQVAISDASSAYQQALDLMIQEQISTTDSLIHEQVAHLEALLGRIELQ